MTVPNADNLGPLRWLVQESPLWDQISGAHTITAGKQPVGPTLAIPIKRPNGIMHWLINMPTHSFAFIASQA